MAILDTADIREQMLAWRHADQWQVQCMSFLSDTIDVFKAVAQLQYNGQDDAERHRLVIMQTLAIRLLNTIGAADEMLVQGYYQQTAILVRDIMECSFLLDLFSRKPEHLQPWIALGTDAGKKVYSPVAVRLLLEELDGPEAAVRQRLYSFYSSHGTHPNAEGILFIAPNNAVEIGPFADQHRLTALTGDMARLSVMAATHLGQWLILSGIDLVDDDVFRSINGLLETVNARFFELNALLQQMPGMANEIEPQ
jgi:hypothetical protein